MKKLISTVLAIACISGTVGITASAEETYPTQNELFGKGYELTDGENGLAIIQKDTYMTDLLVVTDGTELEDITNPMVYYNVYKAEKCQELTETELGTLDNRAVLSQYGDDAKYYMVTLNHQIGTPTIYYGRKLMKDHDFILDVFSVSIHQKGYANPDRGALDIYINGGYPVVNDNEELSALITESNEKWEALTSEDKENYKKWLADHKDWWYVADPEDFDRTKLPSALEVVTSRLEYGCMSDYDYMKLSLSKAEELKEAFPDYITIRPGFDYYVDLWSAEEYRAWGHLTSVWKYVGDINTEDISTDDASLILSHVSSLGAGGDGVISSDYTAFSDINCNNRIDTSDAAILLEYIAAQGSGNSVSLAELSRQNG